MSMRRTQGFTLIEVLVAMSVFAVMTILAYMSLGQTLANADMLGERMDRLQAIQRTMRYLSNDLSAASPRPVRSELGDTYMPALMVSAANDFRLFTGRRQTVSGVLQRPGFDLFQQRAFNRDSGSRREP